MYLLGTLFMMYIPVDDVCVLDHFLKSFSWTENVSEFIKISLSVM